MGSDEPSDMEPDVFTLGTCSSFTCVRRPYDATLDDDDVGNLGGSELFTQGAR